MNLLPTKEASKLLNKAWNLDQKALLYTKNKKQAKVLWKESMKICEKLLKEFSDNINLLFKIATIYQHQGKFDKSKYFLYKAKKYYPENFLVEYYLGNLYRAKSNHKLAVKYYEMAFKHSRGNKLIKQSLENYKKFLKSL
ncbi:MAG: tetratricopeptide repeat protein [Candidatus Niyogibacteria bacterium]|nr:tetratricopeptide repeat protein [Candidatus Niyogibacteria bacterium]